MKTCLQNCRPGDLIHCSAAHGGIIIYTVTKVVVGRVEVNDSHGPAGYFYTGNEKFVLKIVKKK